MVIIQYYLIQEQLNIRKTGKDSASITCARVEVWKDSATARFKKKIKKWPKMTIYIYQNEIWISNLLDETQI